MRPALSRHAALPVTRWKNDAGRRAEIATGKDWVVGFAWLDEDAPFSDYPNAARTIMLLEGPGFVLTIEGHPTVRVERVHEIARFPGDLPTQCTILGGPCVVLNAVTSGLARHHVAVMDVTEAAAVTPERDEIVFLVALTPGVTFVSGGATLEPAPRDAIELSGPAEARGPAGAKIAKIRIAPT